MSTIAEMLETTPSEPAFDAAALVEAIDALENCAQACTACADACLAEEMVGDLVACIRLNLDCADVCEVTTRVLSRQVQPDRELDGALLRACARACASCAEECERHADMHEHCRVCAQACRTCAERCEALLAA